ncbi:hypothetical protein WEI85_34275 [Actinomycetes bacterium KLBMP 9797]
MGATAAPARRVGRSTIHTGVSRATTRGRAAADRATVAPPGARPAASPGTAHTPASRATTRGPAHHRSAEPPAMALSGARYTALHAAAAAVFSAARTGVAHPGFHSLTPASAARTAGDAGLPDLAAARFITSGAALSPARFSTASPRLAQLSRGRTATPHHRVGAATGTPVTAVGTTTSAAIGAATGTPVAATVTPVAAIGTSVVAVGRGAGTAATCLAWAGGRASRCCSALARPAAPTCRPARAGDSAAATG